ncbi:MAG: hypothetical protein Q9N68_06315 [Gammaproteobacteria bacterium]|nr:hypothetical protein [Gammaproteobacteria bacterium]
MRVNKNVLLVLLTLSVLLSACSVEAPKLINTHLYKGDVMQAERFIEAQIKRCWLNNADFDAVLEKTTNSERREASFRLSRVASEAAFLILNLAGNTASTAMVEVNEGDYSTFKRLGLAEDVERWVLMDYSC